MQSRPSSTGELKVDENEVGARARDQRRDLRAGAGDADDVEAVGVLEDLTDRLEDQRVVDRDDDASCSPVQRD